jgi:hypothetical protein
MRKLVVGRVLLPDLSFVSLLVMRLMTGVVMTRSLEETSRMARYDAEGALSFLPHFGGRRHARFTWLKRCPTIEMVADSAKLCHARFRVVLHCSAVQP